MVRNVRNAASLHQNAGYCHEKGKGDKYKQRAALYPIVFGRRETRCSLLKFSEANVGLVSLNLTDILLEKKCPRMKV